MAKYLVKNSFFGLPLNINFFNEFYSKSLKLIEEIEKYDPVLSNVSLSDILKNMTISLSDSLKENLLDNKYNIEEKFEFKKVFNKKIIPFLTIKDTAAKDIKKGIDQITKTKVMDIKSRKEKGENKKTISFKSSKIPDAIFWKEYLNKIKYTFTNEIKDLKFRFEDLNVQENEEDENNGDIS